MEVEPDTWNMPKESVTMLFLKSDKTMPVKFISQVSQKFTIW